MNGNGFVHGWRRLCPWMAIAKCGMANSFLWNDGKMSKIAFALLISVIKCSIILLFSNGGIAFLRGKRGKCRSFNEGGT